MPKGRRPLPTNLKKLRGNPGKRKLPKAGEEPSPRLADPVMPAGLSEMAQQEWKDILPILRDMKVLTAADGKALAAYCHNFARWLQAESEMDRHGIMIEEPILGGPIDDREIVGYKYKRNPCNSISNDAQKIMKSFLIEFGLTPASRAKLRVEKPSEPDPFDAYLAGKSVGDGASRPN
jgi:P27 family predicted phage terminase small subunit